MIFCLRKSEESPKSQLGTFKEHLFLEQMRISFFGIEKSEENCGKRKKVMRNIGENYEGKCGRL